MQHKNNQTYSSRLSDVTHYWDEYNKQETNSYPPPHPSELVWFLGKIIVSLIECKDVDQNTDNRDLCNKLYDVIDVMSYYLM